jgi:histidinol dehydrogenase
MLRIITDQAEALTELGRINHRSTDRDFRLQETAVRDILERVRVQGDTALLPSADSPLKTPSLRVSGSELDVAYQQIPKDLLSAIQVACRQLDAFHRQQLPKSWVKFAEDEVVQGKRYLPVQRAGLYVSGSRGSRLSNLLMQAIPAKVAQVPQIVMVTPGNGDYKIAPDLLVAAQEVGIEEIYRLDSVKAIAALAYGTRSIPKVEVITGTGDLEVAIAKNLVNGLVRIDNPIERTDLVIIADSSANPLQIAVDLLSKPNKTPLQPSFFLPPIARLPRRFKRLFRIIFKKIPKIS